MRKSRNAVIYGRIKLHGQYLKDIHGKVNTKKAWNRLINGDMKKETDVSCYSTKSNSGDKFH